MITRTLYDVVDGDGAMLQQGVEGLEKVTSYCADYLHNVRRDAVLTIRKREVVITETNFLTMTLPEAT